MTKISRIGATVVAITMAMSTVHTVMAEAVTEAPQELKKYEDFGTDKTITRMAASNITDFAGAYNNSSNKADLLASELVDDVYRAYGTVNSSITDGVLQITGSGAVMVDNNQNNGIYAVGVQLDEAIPFEGNVGKKVVFTCDINVTEANYPETPGTDYQFLMGIPYGFTSDGSTISSGLNESSGNVRGSGIQVVPYERDSNNKVTSLTWMFANSGGTVYGAGNGGEDYHMTDVPLGTTVKSVTICTIPDSTSSYTYDQILYTADGTKILQRYGLNGKATELKSFKGLIVGATKGMSVDIDNVRIYMANPDVDVTATAGGETTDLALDGEFTVKFNGYLKETTAETTSNIWIEDSNGEKVDCIPEYIQYENEMASEVKFDFDYNELTAGETYSVKWSNNLRTESHDDVVEIEEGISFTTDANAIPIVPVTGVVNYSNGVGADYVGGDINALGLSSVEMTLKNATSKKKNATILYVIYDSLGRMKGVTFTDVELDGNEEKTVMTGMTLDTEGTVKAFVWNSISGLTPYFDGVSKTY